MIATLILAAAAAGQPRVCETAQSYRRLQSRAVAYSAPAYYAPAYTQAYATTYAQPYVEVKFAPVIYDQYYAGLVGGDARAAGRREAVADQLAAISTSIDRLAARVGQPAPVVVAPPPPPVVPVAPGKPTPDVPAKPEPPVEPPPKTNPAPGDNGDVPPPPPVPSTPPPPPDPNPGPGPNPNPGAARLASPPPAAVVSVFQSRCSKCHTAPAKAGKGFVMFAAPGKIANFDGGTLLRIDTELFSGDMPKNADPLEPREYTPIRVWINENKPVTDTYLAACRALAAARP